MKNEQIMSNFENSFNFIKEKSNNFTKKVIKINEQDYVMLSYSKDLFRIFTKNGKIKSYMYGVRIKTITNKGGI